MELDLDKIIDHSTLSLKAQLATLPALEDQDVLDRFRVAFAKQREDISKEVYRCASMMRNIKELSSIQTASLSLRQRLLEDSHILMAQLYEIRKKYNQRRGVLFGNIVNNLQLRIKTLSEKDGIVDGDEEVLKIKMNIDLLGGQVEFYSDTIKTVDELIYGMRTRIDMEKLLGGG